MNVPLELAKKSAGALPTEQAAHRAGDIPGGRRGIVKLHRAAVLVACLGILAPAFIAIEKREQLVRTS